ncbi:hypothetical protein TSH100_11145 [Azospirillum sp. TSH100]|uniref:DUF1624 domain-containing protein n=1 Tax=Azospirillum sp. TSH100 TaxID=652764 RepID=UPI000D611C95|nr:heparan-alpha-glucosaminide N-acetyltransferase [Azospirillum sp. TSH100]PWC86938.1 hypothetical protein TSH100_11145 [Azospirillum sp. TSH100]QCG91576.1 DUF1624 domain-containing protein [Azospirillum sp. TSH100]
MSAIGITPEQGLARTSRRPAIDVARGLALLAMAAYHASWDATYFGLAGFDLLGDPLWLAARTVILSSFLLLAGIGLVLATRDGFHPGRFLRRLGRVAAGAAAVSAASYALFPDSPIFFGVLHHIAVASVIGLAFVRLPAPVTLAVAAAAVLVGTTQGFAPFDSPWLRWIGLTSMEPDSNDFVPLLPWIGGVLAGIGVGRLWPGLGEGVAVSGPAGRLLALAGRHSLAVYLLHQPLLFGIAWTAAQLMPAQTPAIRDFQASCVASCERAGVARATCTANCGCVQSELARNGLWEDFAANRVSERGQRGLEEAVAMCRKP